MRTVDIDEVKINLDQLIDAAGNGEPLIITRSGKPAVKVMAVDTWKSGTGRRIGFLDSRFSVPDDFDHMGSTGVETLFEGNL